MSNNNSSGQSKNIYKFEHQAEPLLPRKKFLQRVSGFVILALVIVAVSWFVGILGYHFFEHMPWLDATLNAAMILGGMGPVTPLYTPAGKLFASVYALFSGIVFLISVGVLMAPVVHRLFHKFYLQPHNRQ